MKTKIPFGIEMGSVAVNGEQLPAYIFRESRGKKLFATGLCMVMVWASWLMYQNADRISFSILGIPVGFHWMLAVLGMCFFFCAAGYLLWHAVRPQGFLALTARGIHVALRQTFFVPWENIGRSAVILTENQASLYLWVTHADQLPSLVPFQADMQKRNSRIEWDWHSSLHIFTARAGFVSSTLRHYFVNPEARVFLGTEAELDVLAALSKQSRATAWDEKAGEISADSGTDRATESRATESQRELNERVNKRLKYEFGEPMSRQQVIQLLEELTAPISPVKIFERQGLHTIFIEGSGAEMFGPFSLLEEQVGYVRELVERAPIEVFDVLLGVLTDPPEKLAADAEGWGQVKYELENILQEWAHFRPEVWKEKAAPYLHDIRTCGTLISAMVPAMVPQHWDELKKIAADPMLLSEEELELFEELVKQTALPDSQAVARDLAAALEARRNTN